MDVTAYFAAVSFERDEEGGITAGEPREARSEIAAKCLAAAMAATQAGAVAFSRIGDSSSCGLGDAVILASYGDVADEVRQHEDAACC